MSFEELQAIWNSQKLSDISTKEDEVLLAVVEKSRAVNRIVTATDTVMIATLLFVAAMFFRDPLLQGHDLVLILPGIACIVAAAFVWKWRRNREKRQTDFSASLMGIIEKSIDSLEDRILLMQKFLWWFVCPNALGLIIALLIIDQAKRYLLYSIFIPAFVFCIGLAYWQIRREIRLRIQPEKKALEALRMQLANDEHAQ